MKTIYIPILLFLLTCSCSAPRVVTTIIPEAKEGHYAMGREYIPLESDLVNVELGYDGIQGDNLVFDFVVYNASVDSLTIYPDSFFYVLLDSATAESSLENSWYSVNPDTVLAYYDHSLEERKKSKGLNTFFGVLQAGANILYNTSGFMATENPGFIVDAVFQTVGTAQQYVAQDKMIASEMQIISEEKELVKEEIFRTGKLAPGGTASGFVYFPVNEECSYYMFCFPMENELFQFVYKQKKEIVYWY